MYNKIEINYLIILIVFVTIIDAQFRSYSEAEYCYTPDTEKTQTRHFGIKTAYQLVRESESSKQYYVPNCNPTKIWILSRYGTRSPSAVELNKLKELIDLRDEIIANYDQRRQRPDSGGLCNEDLTLIRNWRWNANLTGNFDEHLTVQGWNDLKFLASHFQRIFPNVVDKVYAPDRFTFRHAKAQRCEASYKAFVEGLFGISSYQHINLPPPLDNDALLRPFDSCDKWQQIKKDSIGINSEAVRFEKSDIYTEFIRNVSTKLGFNFPLDNSKIQTIWDMCRYDQSSMLNQASPWCSAFTPSQINILEYYEDLKYYYRFGYGNELNSKVTCSLISDMLKHLESNDFPKVVAYFGHSDTLGLFESALGASKVNLIPLTADSYERQLKRRWRTSYLNPFAGNIAAVKYECPSELEKYNIMFFLNETPMDFSWCNVGLCKWSDVKRMLAEFSNADCSKIYCGNSAPGTIVNNMKQTTSVISALLIPLVYIVFLKF